MAVFRKYDAVRGIHLTAFKGKTLWQDLQAGEAQMHGLMPHAIRTMVVDMTENVPSDTTAIRLDFFLSRLSDTYASAKQSLRILYCAPLDTVAYGMARMAQNLAEEKPGLEVEIVTSRQDLDRRLSCRVQDIPDLELCSNP